MARGGGLRRVGEAPRYCSFQPPTLWLRGCATPPVGAVYAARRLVRRAQFGWHLSETEKAVVDQSRVGLDVSVDGHVTHADGDLVHPTDALLHDGLRVQGDALLLCTTAWHTHHRRAFPTQKGSERSAKCPIGNCSSVFCTAKR